MTDDTQFNRKELIDRGHLALRAMKLKQRAAEFQAVAADLEAALADADRGDSERLLQLLDRAESQNSFTDHISFESQADSFEEKRENDREAQNEIANRGSPAEAQLDFTRWTWERMLASPERSASSIGHKRALPSLDALRTLVEHRRSPTASQPSSAQSLQQRALQKRVADDSSVGSVRRTQSGLVTAKPTLNKASPSEKTGASPSVPSKQVAALAAVAVRSEPETDWQSMTVWERVRFWVLTKAAVLLSSWFISLVAHAVLVLGLLTIAIKVIDKKERISVVASTIESEDVLMETPLEQPKEMDVSDLTDLTVPNVQMSELIQSDVDVQSTVQADLTDLAGTFQAANQTVTGSSVSKMLGETMGSLSDMASANFFGVSAAGNNFCYVVDCSGSMRRDEAFSAAKNELMRSIASLKPTQRFYVYFFSEEVEGLAIKPGEPEKYPVYATKENIQATARWVQTIKIKGGRPPNDALEAAIEMAPDAIFLLFDGDTSVDVPAFLRRVNRVTDFLSGESVRVPIHTLGFYTREFESMMVQLAKENEGTYRHIPNPRKPGK